MIITSQAIIIRPKVTSRYLWMMAATISRTARTSVAVEYYTRPTPHMAAPIRQAMKSCPGPRICGGTPSGPLPTFERTIEKSQSEDGECGLDTEFSV